MGDRKREKGEKEEKEEPREEPAKDYYAGYFWGNNPYSSTEELSGRKTDEDLKSDVIENLKNNLGYDLSDVEVRVVDSAVTLTGSIKTYEQKRKIGKKVWDTKGVVKVLNELQVTDATTVGPSKRPQTTI